MALQGGKAMTELEALKAKYKLVKELIADGLATEQDLDKIKKQIDNYINKLFAD